MAYNRLGCQEVSVRVFLKFELPICNPLHLSAAVGVQLLVNWLNFGIATTGAIDSYGLRSHFSFFFSFL